MMKKWLSMGLVALGCLGLFAVAVAADPPPSGSVRITSTAVALGVGVTWGDGQLTYEGKTHAFKVEGLSVADLGIASVSSTGEVFSLNKLADFDGNYNAGEAGIAVAAGSNDVVMKNQHGVVIRLHGTQQGGRLTLAAQGVKLTLK